MSKSHLNQPLAIALGTVVALGAGSASAASTQSLFVASELASGYAVAVAGDGKTGEKAADHACGGEGGCGGDMGADAGKADDKKADAKKSGDHAGHDHAGQDTAKPSK